ncbi:DUF523 domain-containing protein [Oceanospirillaceae bacterium ASx5O]|nr:DUF523 domain-containing protein [Oceanospirillaceae bacterium ASx5O]
MAPQLHSLHSSTPLPRIPVGISACLMGHEVRYNGSHKRSRYCTDTLSQYFDFVSLCPEDSGQGSWHRTCLTIRWLNRIFLARISWDAGQRGSQGDTSPCNTRGRSPQ